MQYGTPNRFGPSQTPLVLRHLLVWMGGIALASTIISLVLVHWVGIWTPQNILSLSTWGIDSVFLWQFLTYMFVGPGNLSLGFVLYLLFTLYLIWFAGAGIIDRVGPKPFFRLLFLSAVLGGIAGWLILLAMPPGIMLAGAMIPAYGLLFATMLLNPNKQLMLFLAIPIKMRTMICGLLVLNLLLCVGDQLYAEMVAYVVAAFTGYVYALTAWNVPGPFDFSSPFDEWCNHLGVRIRKLLHKRSRYIADDDFTEAMLDKITKNGLDALTRKERKRMEAISARG